MHNIRQINDSYYYIGCSERRLPLFESAYKVPNGMSYNSYILIDEKTALFDTVDKSCCGQFMENLDAALGERTLDYLIVSHMEPDHAALIGIIKNKFPNLKIVCTKQAENMIKQFFNFDMENSVIVIQEGQTLSIGKHELTFMTAPMVHWPEVMVTYDKTDKILFSADAFGNFGAINGNLFDSQIDWENEYLSEARRYYTNIVGKYGMQVQNLLKKVSGIDIKMICPLHGVIIVENIEKFVQKYNLWSKYEPEEKSVMFVYSSVYGNTENTVNILASKVADLGVKNIKIFDVSFYDNSEILSNIFKYSTVVFATTTYNMDIFESMKHFIDVLTSHNIQNRTFGLIQNGSWAPNCISAFKKQFECLKNIKFIEPELTVKSTLKENQNIEIENMAKALAESLK